MQPHHHCQARVPGTVASPDLKSSAPGVQASDLTPPFDIGPVAKEYSRLAEKAMRTMVGTDRRLDKIGAAVVASAWRLHHDDAVLGRFSKIVHQETPRVRPKIGKLTLALFQYLEAKRQLAEGEQVQDPREHTRIAQKLSKLSIGVDRALTVSSTASEAEALFRLKGYVALAKEAAEAKVSGNPEMTSPPKVVFAEGLLADARAAGGKMVVVLDLSAPAAGREVCRILPCSQPSGPENAVTLLPSDAEQVSAVGFRSAKMHEPGLADPALAAEHPGRTAVTLPPHAGELRRFAEENSLAAVTAT